MAAKTFNTSNETYRHLLSGGSVYQIPRFQRDYSWKEEHWEDLWADILELMTDEESSHYMGYLVLQPKADRSLDIIDGQQRLTTLSLLILAAMRKMRELVQAGIDQEHNETRLNEIRRTYIGQIDPVSLTVSSKLTLNRNNDHYYQTFLVTLRDMPSRGFKASEHAMRKATDWFARKLGELLRDSGKAEEQHGIEIARLVEKFSNGLFFTVITVDDELNAYKVFETLNARGVKLSAPDLLKNYLFSVISSDTGAAAHDAELDAIEARWSNILERLQSENITSFLRSYWGANNAFVRQSELFKVIKRAVTSRKHAYALISGLEDGLETYLSLTQPDQSDWTGDDKDNAKLLKMFSVRQPFALLMAARENIPDGFSQILKGIVNITFRYNVISNLQAAEQERTYSRVAIGISDKTFTNANEVLRELRSVYPSDNVFKASFSTKRFDTTNSRNKQIVRYILAKLDAQISAQAFSMPGPEITIEHILPENPHDNWRQFNDVEAAAEVYRIGNMTLLEGDLNREAANGDYGAKMVVFPQSGISLTSSIPESYEDWTVQSINTRQDTLARAATGIWRVAQLH